jgi:hypothetical protein
MPPKEKVDQDQADENAVQPLDERIGQVQLDGGGKLVASIVAELVDCYKHIPKPYAQATQGQQQDVFRRFETLAKTIVQQAAEQIAAHDADRSVMMVVGDAKVGSDIKVDLKLAPVTTEGRDAAILFLAHARGRMVMLRMASADEYDTEPLADPSEPDQADMAFEAGSDTIDEDQDGEAEQPADSDLESAEQ